MRRSCASWGRASRPLRGALKEIGRWPDTVVATYSEFGRRAQENLSGGTDHGTASVHFAMGGAVRGGLAGRSPSLDRLDASGNLAFTTDFRAYYAGLLAGTVEAEVGRIPGGHAPLALFKG